MIGCICCNVRTFHELRLLRILASLQLDRHTATQASKIWYQLSDVHDLIAFRPDATGRWWRRRGDVDLLGANNITPWRLSPLVIHETPLSWLQAGANGIVIINWGLDPIARLGGTGYLETETPALKRRLERRIP